MRRLAVVGLLLAMGCGGEDPAPSPDARTQPDARPDAQPDAEVLVCGLPSLPGTWRWHYLETNGNCGAMADETGPITGTHNPACTFYYDNISSDRCRREESYVCPTLDGQGTQAWVTIWVQVAAGEILGTGTVQLDHPAGICRSTYDMVATRL